MQYRYDLDRCQSFQSRQINHRIIARHAAHFQLRSQAAADCRTFRLPEYAATKIVRQLHATNTRRLAIRHTGDCRRNRRRGATGTTIGATTKDRHALTILSPFSYSLFILQFVQHINELKCCIAYFVEHLHERRDSTGDCAAQCLTLREGTLTVRKLQNLLANHIDTRRDITLPRNGFCPIYRGCAFARHNAYHLIKCWFSYLAT